jgi:internalin A
VPLDSDDGGLAPSGLRRVLLTVCSPVSTGMDQAPEIVQELLREEEAELARLQAASRARRKNDRLVKALSDAGVDADLRDDGTVTAGFRTESDWKSAWSMIAGDDRIRSLELRGAPVTDAALAELKGLRMLDTVTIIDTKITGAGLQALARLPSLQQLCVSVDSGWRDGMRWIGRCRMLRKLEIAGDFRDEDLALLGELSDLEEFKLHAPTPLELKVLADLTRLKSLILSRTPVGDDVMTLVSHLADLRQLEIEACPVTDRGFEQLAQLTRLESLSASGEHITARGIQHLAKLPALRSFGLRTGKLDDAMVDVLCRFQKLESLHLFQMNITRAQGVRLRHSLPDCWLSVGDSDLLNDEITASLLEFLKEGEIDYYIDDTGGILINEPLRKGDAFCRRFGGVVRLRRVNFHRSRLSDAGLAHVLGMRWLEELEISGTQVTPDGLKVILQIPRLSTLDVTIPESADTVLQTIGACKNLESLEISARKPLDVGMRHLAGLKKLKKLRILARWRSSYEVLNELTALEELEMLDADVRDAALEALRRHPALRVIVISNCKKLSDCGLAELGTCPQLERMSLYELPVTGQFFAAFRGHANLQRIYARSLPLTETAVQALCDLTLLEDMQVYDAPLSLEQEKRIIQSLAGNDPNILFATYTPQGRRVHTLLDGEETVQISPLRQP